MFKSKKADKHMGLSAPAETKNFLAEAAERERLRGEKIGALAKEAQMWRAFAATCAPGRSIAEDIRFLMSAEDWNSALSVVLDEITAPAWSAFAMNMASTADQRLREILG